MTGAEKERARARLIETLADLVARGIKTGTECVMMAWIKRLRRVIVDDAVEEFEPDFAAAIRRLRSSARDKTTPRRENP
jgi:hypothetical protein